MTIVKRFVESGELCSLDILIFFRLFLLFLINFKIAVLVLNHEPQDMQRIFLVRAAKRARPNDPDSQTTGQVRASASVHGFSPVQFLGQEVLARMVPLHDFGIRQQCDAGLVAGRGVPRETGAQHALVGFAEFVQVIVREQSGGGQRKIGRILVVYSDRRPQRDMRRGKRQPAFAGIKLLQKVGEH